MKPIRNSILYISILLFFYGCALHENTDSYINESNSKYRVLNYDDMNLKRISNKFKNLNPNTALAVKFFGDSHIASDDLAGGFRDTFFAKAPVNSVGFALASLPKYHNHNLLNYNQNGFDIVDSRNKRYNDFPLCGVISNAKQGAVLNLELKEKFKMPMVFELIFKSENLGKVLSITDARSKEFIVTNYKKGIWQKAIFEISLPINLSVLQDLQLSRYYIYQKNAARFADICGINGAFSNIYKGWRDRAFNDGFHDIKYDLIAIAYGTNDAFDENLDEMKFYQNLKTLIQKIRRTQPNAVILLISPPTTYKAKFKIVQQMIRKLAIDERTLFYDIEYFMNLTGSKSGWIEQGLSKKDVHLTRLGYKKVGNDLANELKKLLLNFK